MYFLKKRLLDQKGLLFDQGDFFLFLKFNMYFLFLFFLDGKIVTFQFCDLNCVSLPEGRRQGERVRG